MTTRPDNISQAKKTSGETSKTKATIIELPSSLSVRQLADLLQVSPVDIIKQLMRNGILANINQIIDFEAAARAAADLGYEAHQKAAKAVTGAKKARKLSPEEAGKLKPRPPVVTIMGHVDHGKTKLLDAIRQANVAGDEPGSITQHIGAYQVDVKGQKITFLDTPGHEAFTAMRARGAQVTDVAIIVVAADDGVQPQTVEAINHAKAAGVPIVVAINKIDKPTANPEMVKQQLSEIGVMVEEWGGDVIAVPVSAKERKGIPELLENILLVAEMEDLKADPSKPATGVVIEAELDKTRGPLATVLIQDGTLRVSDTAVVGSQFGKVKAMFNDQGKQVRKAEPATAVKILGLSNVAEVGDTVTVVADEREARSLIQKQQPVTKKAVSLTDLFDQITAGKVKELNIILKTDVQGSIEPIVNSLEKLSTEQVRVRIIHSGTGNINESDVLLAAASEGLIIGFNVTTEAGARRAAEAEGVDVRHYKIIYDIIDDVTKALKGMLEPVVTEVIEGRAEIRAVFPAGKKEKAAGVMVTDGKITRDGRVRVYRGGKVILESTVSSLRRFKEDVREVAAGYEGGVGIKDFSDYQVGDILEFFRMEKSK